MKKRMGIFITLLFTLLFAVNVWADESRGEEPDYPTDYYMVVECAEGGVNLYDEASLEAEKLNEELIPNGTALHILGEKTGENNSHWVYVEHRNVNGYVPSDHLKPVTVGEAAKSEYFTYNGFSVEFDVTVKDPDGIAPLRKGPGDQFGKVSQGLEDGKKVHVTQYVETAPGRAWGKVVTEVTEGWLDLTRNSDFSENEAVVETVIETGMEAGAIPAPTATPEPTATAVPTATPAPTVTIAPTATPEPTTTVEPTATAEPTEKTEPTEEPSKEASPSEKPERKDAQEEKSGGNYLIWILLLVVAVLAVVYFFKRKK